QQEAAGVVLSQREAQRQLEQAVADANETISENGKTLDRTTQKGRENEAALDNIADSTWDVIAAMQKNGASQKQLQGVMQTSRDRFIAVARAAGMSADEANALADELGLIPSQVKTDIIANTGTAMRNVENFKAAMAGIQDRRVQITTAFEETGIRPPAGFYAPSGERASGGAVTAGKTYLVGENAPELFTAPAHGTLSSHGATVARTQSGIYTTSGHTPNVNVTVPAQNLTGLRLEGTMVANGMEARMQAVAVGVVAERDRSSANSRATRRP